MAWDEQHEAKPSSTMSTEDDEIRPSGLRWLRVGTVRPAVGRELKNAKLAMALTSKTAFTKAEWEVFGITDLRKTDFIEGGGFYFQPRRLVNKIKNKNKTVRNELCTPHITLV